MKNVVAGAMFVFAAFGLTLSGYAQNVAPEDLKTVGLIIAASENGQRMAVGTAFFVEVPSRVYHDSAFVYLVTAKHNLLDEEGEPLPQLWIQLQDARGGTREHALPDLSQWILDPVNESVDIAALPLSPNDASFEAISLSRFLDGSKASSIPANAQVGREAYYVTTLGSQQRFVAVTRFGKISVPNPARVDVPGAGAQNLVFLEGTGTPDLSGAPVFVRTSDDSVFLGLLENRSGDAAKRQFGGLIGVLPASYVSETVRAMAAAQEEKPASTTPAVRPAPSTNRAPVGKGIYKRR
jgi:hypothetical protein